MIQKVDGKLFVNGKALSDGDVALLKQMLRCGQPITAFDLMMKVGSTYTQYISNRLRMMVKVYALVTKGPKRGTYEIIPEVREELKKALEGKQ